MTLREFLASTDKSVAEFAKDLGESEHTVRKWVRGERIPRREAMRRIIDFTGGRVTAADLLAAA